MTVVIGIRCSDGIVLGSDGAATLMSQGVATAQQRSMRKLEANDRVLTGFAGHAGLAQRLRAVIEPLLTSDKENGSAAARVQQIRRVVWQNVLQLEMDAAHQTRRALQTSGVDGAAHAELLVATAICGSPELIHFGESGAATIIGDDVPFVAIGAGQRIADPFLGFVRRVFWPTGLPNTAMATFSAMWTLMHVIDANSIGMSKPFQLAILDRKDGDWKARTLSDVDLTLHEDRVRDAESSLSIWAKGAGGPNPAPPT